MAKKLFIIILVLSSSFFCFGANTSLSVFDLKCENLRNPLGIDTFHPRFSWKIRSNKNETVQKLYQILAATDTSLLNEDEADLWNSGIVQSPESILVPYKGKPLLSGLVVYWKVRVWDETGNASSYARIADFSVGLLANSDWKADYIGLPANPEFKECPQLWKSFNVDKQKGKMLLYVNSLGYHEVYLNGEKVGKGVLAPAVSQYNKRSLAVTYDVSPLVKSGRNDLVIWLGSGWYLSGYPGVIDQGPLVKAQLEQVDGFKSEVIQVTDSSWKCRPSNYQRFGLLSPGNYGGELVDGSENSGDLSAGNPENGSWLPAAVIIVPDHEISSQMCENNQIQETIQAISVTQLDEKSFLVDMGKTLTGWSEIEFFELKKSQEIKIEYCDHLAESSQFVNQNQVDKYIASGEGSEIFKNKFNYHGFRYIRISNLAKAPDLKSVKAYLIHTDYELASSFQCSDNELNKIHDMLFYTLRCLSLGGYLVDCPHLERLGYGGDGNASTETAQTMFNINPLYSNWLQAWADCIRNDGGMPHTAPNPFSAGGGPYWCGFIITSSWKTYQNYGDSTVLQKYYPVMQKWLEYVKEYSPDGLLKKWPDTNYRNWYLGDWATPEGIDQTAEASVDLVSNCFLVVCYENMQKIAEVLGKENDAELYQQKKDSLKKLIHQTFYNPSAGRYATGSQIDQTYPLLTGVVPEELTQKINKALAEEITVNRNGHFACGLVGIPVFTEWAIKSNAAELMYSMLKKPGYPGYLYMLENGATSTWEHWNGERSRIHNCYNGIGSWFYFALGGVRRIEDVPAYRKIRIQPQIPNGVTWAKTSKETPYGELVVDWKVKNGKLFMNIKIPVGMDAEIPIPPDVMKYKINRKSFASDKTGKSFLELGSGNYNISYELKPL
jgi:alpha-L-rhamnosidase